MPKSKLHNQVRLALIELDEEVQEYLDHDAVPAYPGICRAVRLNVSDPRADRLVRDLIALWPNASRDRNFPVPSMRKGISPGTAFILARASGRLWDQTTAYGRVRRELLHWMIGELA